MGNIIGCVDIGSSKICTLIARASKTGEMEVLGKAMEPCNGVKKGIIVDIESTAVSIRNCIERAQALANMEIDSAYVNIMGMHASIIHNRSSVNISSEDKEISLDDVENVLQSAEKVKLPEDRQVIDVIPIQYIVDGYDEIVDPVGMSGVKLEVEADVIAGKITFVQNILKSMEKAGLRVNGFVVEALASAEIVLTPEEKEMGVILIDIGGSITNVSVIKNKRLVFYDAIPVGGDHISNDISIGLRIPHQEAEKLKREYELALTSLIKNDHEITVNEINENRKINIKVSEVIEIIEARVHEIFSICREQLKEANVLEGFGKGIVLSGGGISYIDGNMQLAYEVFDLPVRVASYNVSNVTKPEFLISVGTAKYIVNRFGASNTGCEVKKQKKNKGKNTGGFFRKLANLFNGLF
ncbi:cell division protein FtsA [Acetivibrio cellulolyticus]|uniref:cell division protein FtsA n=1 Tax=Acetivibrio cellulolyticus TaxID=35830 RepID=UPI0001E2EB6B|nr:cell division protein FtsA [Acetivibrio cellulolyticus]